MSDLIRAAHSFRRAAFSIERVMRTALKDMGLDPTAYDLLDYIAGSNHATSSGFKAVYTGVNPSYPIKQSVEKGLITINVDAQDARSRIMNLTDGGRDVHRQATARIEVLLSSGGLQNRLGEGAAESDTMHIVEASQKVIDGADRILSRLALAPSEKRY